VRSHLGAEALEGTPVRRDFGEPDQRLAQLLRIVLVVSDLPFNMVAILIEQAMTR